MNRTTLHVLGPVLGRVLGHVSRVSLGGIVLLASVAWASSPVAPQAVDAALPRYQAPPAGAKSLSGTIRISGSSAACGLLARVADAFQASGAAVKVETTGGDSANGVTALAEGTVDAAAMSRPMSAEERSRVEARTGTAPIELVVGLDAIAIYVHKDNPIRSLTVAEVASLFGDGAGGAATAKRWSDVGADKGVSADLQSQSVAAFGVRADAGSSVLLRETALRGAGFRSDLLQQRVPTGVISGIGANKAGVGYAGAAFRSSQATRLVPIAASSGGAPVEPTQDALLNGTYPLGGKVYVYVVRKPAGGLTAPTLEFLRFVLSRDGQEAAAKEGNATLPAATAAAQRQKLG